MSWYFIAEMLPDSEVYESPSREFSPGTGFESTLAEFYVVGPEDDQFALDYDYNKYYEEGFIVEYVRMSDEELRG